MKQENMRVTLIINNTRRREEEKPPTNINFCPLENGCTSSVTRWQLGVTRKQLRKSASILETNSFMKLGSTSFNK